MRENETTKMCENPQCIRHSRRMFDYLRLLRRIDRWFSETQRIRDLVRHEIDSAKRLDAARRFNA